MSLNVEMEGRKTYIDVARGIAMFLVVIGHSGVEKALVQFIYSFHMPLFFFIAGMTSGTNVPYLQYAGKRIKSLFVPYLLAACVYCDGSYKSFLYVAYSSRAAIAGAGSFTPLWFLPCLLGMDLIFNGILRIFARGGNKKVIAVLLLGMLAFLGMAMGCKTPKFGWPLNLDVACVALPFALTGKVFEHSLRRENVVGKFKSRKILILMLCALVFLYRFNLPETMIDDVPRVSMSTGCYGNIVVFYICGLLGALTVLWMSLLFKKNAFIGKFGRETMACLLTHGVVMDVTGKVLGAVGVCTGISLFKVVVCIMVTAPVNAILHYWCPNVIGKPTSS